MNVDHIYRRLVISDIIGYTDVEIEKLDKSLCDIFSDLKQTTRDNNSIMYTKEDDTILIIQKSLNENTSVYIDEYNVWDKLSSRNIDRSIRHICKYALFKYLNNVVDWERIYFYKLKDFYILKLNN